MAKSKINIDVGKLIKNNVILKVRIKKTNEFRVRIWIACKLLIIAARIGNFCWDYKTITEE